VDISLLRSRIFLWNLFRTKV